MNATPLPRIRIDDLEWEVLGTHGLRRKVLGYDPSDQHVTSLVDIPRGWKGGGIAHFHHAFEEVYIVGGSVTVGGTHYWHAGDYFYRPAMVVHGHDERSEEGARALIRSDGLLELLLIHDPAEPEEYSLQPVTDGRGHVLALTPAEMEWTDAADLPKGWRMKLLSADKTTGARTYLAEVPAGWTREGSTKRPAPWEATVLQGALKGDAHEFKAGDYSYGPGGRECFDAAASESGATLLVWEFPRDRKSFACAPRG
jgi:quercetin dioxygenase-like cupin family protein/uncharacterized protein YbdZ (MbtH family)